MLASFRQCDNAKPITCFIHRDCTSSPFEMSIPLQGTRTRSRGLISAIMKQMRLINLTPVKSIDVRFDPFHESIKETRNFLYYISSPKIFGTNPYCALKTEVLCDHSEPTVTFNLQSGDKVILKTALLSSLDIFKLYNKHITSLITVDPAELEAREELRKKRKAWNRRVRVKPGSKRRGVIL